MNVTLKLGQLTVALMKREQKLLEDASGICQAISQLTSLSPDLRAEAQAAAERLVEVLKLSSTFPRQKGLPGLEPDVAASEERQARQ